MTFIILMWCWVFLQQKLPAIQSAVPGRMCLLIPGSLQIYLLQPVLLLHPDWMWVHFNMKEETSLISAGSTTITKKNTWHLFQQGVMALMLLVPIINLPISLPVPWAGWYPVKVSLK